MVCVSACAIDLECCVPIVTNRCRAGTAVPSRGLSVGEEDLWQRLQFAAANAAAHESSLQQSLEQQQQEAERLQLDNRVLCEQLQVSLPSSSSVGSIMVP